MLNYIWLALIVLGIGVALYGDIGDLSANKYHNGETVALVIHPSTEGDIPFSAGRRYLCTITVDRSVQSASLGLCSGLVTRNVTRDHVWGREFCTFSRRQTPHGEILKGLRNPEYLAGRVAWNGTEGINRGYAPAGRGEVREHERRDE
jgi:hypothetical protein